MSRARKFNWLEFLDVARHLSTTSVPNASSEALRRCTVGRAYYAAFGLVRERVEEVQDTSAPTDGTHKWVIENCTDVDGTGTIADNLKLLRALRNRSDYHGEQRVTVDDVTDAFDYTEQILEVLES